MALCPLAIASKGNANDGTGEFYFALNGGGTGPVVDSAFVATGLGTPPNGGTFTTRSQDTTGAGIGAFEITNIAGIDRWTIGVIGQEAGANTGSDLAIFAYADNGAFLTSPMTINRASGGVNMANGLVVNNTLVSTGPTNIGVAATVGGGVLEIDGTLGLGRVFDAVYNPAVPALNSPIAVVTSGPYNGTQATNSTNIGTFTVPRSGMYLLNFSFSNDVAADFGVPVIDGSSIIGASDFVALTVNQAPGINFSTSVKPWSMPSTTNGGSDYLIQSTRAASLITGITYNVFASIVNISGTLKFSDLNGLIGGGAIFSVSVVALC